MRRIALSPNSYKNLLQKAFKKDLKKSGLPHDCGGYVSTWETFFLEAFDLGCRLRDVFAPNRYTFCGKRGILFTMIDYAGLTHQRRSGFIRPQNAPCTAE
jgi:hypothetical protein